MTAVFVAAAGGLGAVLRHLVDQWIGLTPSRWSTFAVNLTGSFAIGLLLGAHLDRSASVVAATGLLGGFTTFSTASVTAAQAIADRSIAIAVLHTLVTAILCIVAAALGYVLPS